jgi:hypothetical protein
LYDRVNQIVLIMLRMPHGCRFCVVYLLLAADIGVAQDIETLGVGGHQAVFNTVVYHLHEVSRARTTAVKIAVLGSAACFGPIRCGRCRI